MTDNNPAGYVGPELTPTVLSLLEILDRYGFRVAATTRFAGKTLNLLWEGERCGYINSTVLGKGAVLGYHFKWSGDASNSCPPELASQLLQIFSEKYQCDIEDLVIHHGTGSNTGRTNLLIRSPTTALSVLLQDTGRPLDESVTIAKVNDRYVEGAVRDVRMQSYERSSAARLACLSHYGYDCFVCGINIRKIYRALPMELVHVHHEEPLSLGSGPRETDPVSQLKPVCPNCHAVIHSRTPAYSIDEVKRMLD